MDSGVNDSVNAIALVGNDVHAGGWFNNAGGRQSLHFAIWHEPVISTFSIALQPGLSGVEVSWPSPSTGWTLQQNTKGVCSADWNNVTGEIQDDGTNVTFLLDQPTGNRFYRLHKP